MYPTVDAPEGWETEYENETVASVGFGGARIDCVSNGVVHKQVVDGETRSFVFGSRVSLNPTPSATASFLLRVVGGQVWSGIEDSLSERGLSPLERTGSRRTKINGVRAKLRRYSAVSADDEPVEAYLAVWADDDICVAGGAYPDEDDLRDTVLHAVYSFR